MEKSSVGMLMNSGGSGNIYVGVLIILLFYPVGLNSCGLLFARTNRGLSYLIS